ncbi:MAG: hypothetical protein WBQ29_22555 [Isosphaeraceae bacterium]
MFQCRCGFWRYPWASHQLLSRPAPDLPKEPVLFGVSLTPRPPSGNEFHLVVPSQVEPIFAKGLVPLFQSITPPSKP